MVSSNIILIRHAKKPEEYLHETGLDRDGQDDPYSLSLEGWRQAKELAALFVSRDRMLPLPDRIFASAFRPGGGHSRRPEQTVLPLSEILQCPIDLTWALHEETEFGSVLANLKGTSLVCWQHQGLAALAKAIVLPEKFSISLDWPPERYNMIWQIHRSNATEPWSFRSYNIAHNDRLELHSIYKLDDAYLSFIKKK
ncbi:phosphoglycerate mutase family protein [Acetobacter sp. AAB5]|uniref:phosphoglycerate mutase family protein n=1 Tax=Acetobacter sp. AAB5 TaxID=3418370 RepID=UPI003CF20438